MALLHLPVSVLLALWIPSPSSRGLAVVQGEDAVHEVLSPEGRSRSLEAWLSALPPVRRVVALVSSEMEPLPGLARLSESGQAVALSTAEGSVLMVPTPSGASVRWRVETLEIPPVPFDTAGSRREVYAATQKAVDTLTSLDLALERPELAEALTDIATGVIDPQLLPADVSPRRRDLLERSVRLIALCEIALGDDGGAVNVAQARARSAVLRPLLDVARRGVAAATQFWHASDPES